MFRKVALIVAVTLLGSGAAAAASTEPLVIKSSYSGYVPPEWERGERCEVYLDHVVITKHFGAVTVEEQRVVKVSPEIVKLIADAATASIESKPNGLCDGPSTSIAATQINADEEPGSVLLFSTGGCGSPRLERQGSAARNLRDLVGTYCATTHDIER